MKSVSAAINRHLSIDRIATPASRYLDLCVAGDAVPNSRRFSFASQALYLFDQVFVAFLEFLQLTRNDHGTYIRYTCRVAHLTERLFVTIHRAFFTREVVVHQQAMPTRENALHVWLAILKTPEVCQNIGLVIIGQFFEWLHFGSTLVTATAKEFFCPSTKSPEDYDDENGQNNKRFHSRFLRLVVITTNLYMSGYIPALHSIKFGGSFSKPESHDV